MATNGLDTDAGAATTFLQCLVNAWIREERCGRYVSTQLHGVEQASHAWRSVRKTPQPTSGGEKKEKRYGEGASASPPPPFVERREARRPPTLPMTSFSPRSFSSSGHSFGSSMRDSAGGMPRQGDDSKRLRRVDDFNRPPLAKGGEKELEVPSPRPRKDEEDPNDAGGGTALLSVLPLSPSTPTGGRGGETDNTPLPRFPSSLPFAASPLSSSRCASSASMDESSPQVLPMELPPLLLLTTGASSAEEREEEAERVPTRTTDRRRGHPRRPREASDAPLEHSCVMLRHARRYLSFLFQPLSVAPPFFSSSTSWHAATRRTTSPQRSDATREGVSSTLPYSPSWWLDDAKKNGDSGGGGGREGGGGSGSFQDHFLDVCWGIAAYLLDKIPASWWSGLSMAQKKDVMYARVLPWVYQQLLPRRQHLPPPFSSSSSSSSVPPSSSSPLQSSRKTTDKQKSAVSQKEGEEEEDEEEAILAETLSLFIGHTASIILVLLLRVLFSVSSSLGCISSASTPEACVLLWSSSSSFLSLSTTLSQLPAPFAGPSLARFLSDAADHLYRLWGEETPLLASSPRGATHRKAKGEHEEDDDARLPIPTTAKKKKKSTTLHNEWGFVVDVDRPLPSANSSSSASSSSISSSSSSFDAGPSSPLSTPRARSSTRGRGGRLEWLLSRPAFTILREMVFVTCVLHYWHRYLRPLPSLERTLFLRYGSLEGGDVTILPPSSSSSTAVRGRRTESNNGPSSSPWVHQSRERPTRPTCGTPPPLWVPHVVATRLPADLSPSEPRRRRRRGWSEDPMATSASNRPREGDDPTRTAAGSLRYTTIPFPSYLPVHTTIRLPLRFLTGCPVGGVRHGMPTTTAAAVPSSPSRSGGAKKSPRWTSAAIAPPSTPLFHAPLDPRSAVFFLVDSQHFPSALLEAYTALVGEVGCALLPIQEAMAAFFPLKPCRTIGALYRAWQFLLWTKLARQHHYLVHRAAAAAAAHAVPRSPLTAWPQDPPRTPKGDLEAPLREVEKLRKPPAIRDGGGGGASPPPRTPPHPTACLPTDPSSTSALALVPHYQATAEEAATTDFLVLGLLEFLRMHGVLAIEPIITLSFTHAVVTPAQCMAQQWQPPFHRLERMLKNAIHGRSSRRKHAHRRRKRTKKKKKKHPKHKEWWDATEAQRKSHETRSAAHDQDDRDAGASRMVFPRLSLPLPLFLQIALGSSSGCGWTEDLLACFQWDVPGPPSQRHSLPSRPLRPPSRRTERDPHEEDEPEETNTTITLSGSQEEEEEKKKRETMSPPFPHALISPPSTSSSSCSSPSLRHGTYRRDRSCSSSSSSSFSEAGVVHCLPPLRLTVPCVWGTACPICEHVLQRPKGWRLRPPPTLPTTPSVAHPSFFASPTSSVGFSCSMRSPATFHTPPSSSSVFHTTHVDKTMDPQPLFHHHPHLHSPPPPHREETEEWKRMGRRPLPCSTAIASSSSSPSLAAGGSFSSFLGPPTQPTPTTLTSFPTSWGTSVSWRPPPPPPAGGNEEKEEEVAPHRHRLGEWRRGGARHEGFPLPPPPVLSVQLLFPSLDPALHRFNDPRLSALPPPSTSSGAVAHASSLSTASSTAPHSCPRDRSTSLLWHSTSQPRSHRTHGVVSPSIPSSPVVAGRPHRAGGGSPSSRSPVSGMQHHCRTPTTTTLTGNTFSSSSSSLGSSLATTIAHGEAAPLQDASHPTIPPPPPGERARHEAVRSPTSSLFGGSSFSTSSTISATATAAFGGSTARSLASGRKGEEGGGGASAVPWWPPPAPHAAPLAGSGGGKTISPSRPSPHPFSGSREEMALVESGARGGPDSKTKQKKLKHQKHDEEEDGGISGTTAQSGGGGGRSTFLFPSSSSSSSEEEAVEEKEERLAGLRPWFLKPQLYVPADPLHGASAYRVYQQLCGQMETSEGEENEEDEDEKEAEERQKAKKMAVLLPSRDISVVGEGDDGVRATVASTPHGASSGPPNGQPPHPHEMDCLPSTKGTTRVPHENTEEGAVEAAKKEKEAEEALGSTTLSRPHVRFSPLPPFAPSSSSSSSSLLPPCEVYGPYKGMKDSTESSFSFPHVLAPSHPHASSSTFSSPTPSAVGGGRTNVLLRPSTVPLEASQWLHRYANTITERFQLGAELSVLLVNTAALVQQYNEAQREAPAVHWDHAALPRWKYRPRTRTSGNTTRTRESSGARRRESGAVPTPPQAAALARGEEKEALTAAPQDRKEEKEKGVVPHRVEAEARTSPSRHEKEEEAEEDGVSSSSPLLPTPTILPQRPLPYIDRRRSRRVLATHHGPPLPPQTCHFPSGVGPNGDEGDKGMPPNAKEENENENVPPLLPHATREGGERGGTTTTTASLRPALFLRLSTSSTPPLEQFFSSIPLLVNGKRIPPPVRSSSAVRGMEPNDRTPPQEGRRRDPHSPDLSHEKRHTNATPHRRRKPSVSLFPPPHEKEEGKTNDGKKTHMLPTTTTTRSAFSPSLSSASSSSFASSSRVCFVRSLLRRYHPFPYSAWSVLPSSCSSSSSFMVSPSSGRSASTAAYSPRRSREEEEESHVMGPPSSSSSSLPLLVLLQFLLHHLVAFLWCDKRQRQTSSSFPHLPLPPPLPTAIPKWPPETHLGSSPKDEDDRFDVEGVLQQLERNLRRLPVFLRALPTVHRWAQRGWRSHHIQESWTATHVVAQGKRRLTKSTPLTIPTSMTDEMSATLRNSIAPPPLPATMTTRTPAEEEEDNVDETVKKKKKHRPTTPQDIAGMPPQKEHHHKGTTPSPTPNRGPRLPAAAEASVLLSMGTTTTMPPSLSDIPPPPPFSSVEQFWFSILDFQLLEAYELYDMLALLPLLLPYAGGSVVDGGIRGFLSLRSAMAVITRQWKEKAKRKQDQKTSQKEEEEEEKEDEERKESHKKKRKRKEGESKRKGGESHIQYDAAFIPPHSFSSSPFSPSTAASSTVATTATFSSTTDVMPSVRLLLHVIVNDFSDLFIVSGGRPPPPSFFLSSSSVVPS